MTYDEFRRQLGKAGVTAREFAELLSLNPNSITNYARQGEVPSHLTVRQSARLQTFPDWFEFVGRRNHRYTQIGNAVPPQLARAVAQALHDALEAAPTNTRSHCITTTA